jgi:hypothetical protein
MNPQSLSTVNQPGVTVALSHWPEHNPPVNATSARMPVERADCEPINWWLIALALGYALLSYVLLAPSIWVRMLLASFLILRMRPDMVIPYFISCLQLKLNFSGAVTGDFDIGGNTMAVGLTGFESYAFAIPPLLISVRTAFAAADQRVDRSRFPSGLYSLWAVGGILVVVGAFTILGSGRGWTGAMRLYSIVGGVFYGMLMPRMSSRQMNRLATGMACVCLVYFVTLVTATFGGKLTFVIGPIGASWAAIHLLSRKRLVLGSILLVLTGSVCLFKATLMVFGTWVWAVLASCIAQVTTRQGQRNNRAFAAFVLASVVFCAFLFVVGVTRKVNERQQFDASFLGRIEYKLYADRGPIWYGCISALIEEPSLFPTPERAFMVEWLEFNVLWIFGPHNLFLELLNQLGMVAGPIAIVVMAYTVAGCVGAVGRDPSSGVRTLAIATLCSIVVGGLTLPYSVGDRLGENVLIPAGMAIANSWGMPGSAWWPGSRSRG